MKRERRNKKISTFVRTVSKMEPHYSHVSKFIGFITHHEKSFVVFGVPNTKYLAFGTLDENGPIVFSLP